MVLVTHGRLAAEFIAALEHVVGPQRNIAAVCIGPDDDMEKRRQDILRSVGEVDAGNGVVLLTDMFGGTPSNLAISIMDKAKIEVIAGINLPMLIKLASLRQNETLANAVRGAQEAGRKRSFWPTPADGRFGRIGRRDRAAKLHHLQSTRASCPRGGAVREAGLRVPVRGHGEEERDHRLGPLDHGPDDAGRRARHRDRAARDGKRCRQGGRCAGGADLRRLR
jgi:mannose PTS system EIIA component